jgi:hypothetical protein
VVVDGQHTHGAGDGDRRASRASAPAVAATFGQFIDEAIGEDRRRIADGLSPPLLATQGRVAARV